MVTLGEVKQVLHISDSNSDALIDALIPVVIDYIVDYTKNKFVDSKVYIQSDTIAFAENDDAGTLATITDSNGKFLEEKFSSNSWVYVEGSLRNDKFFRVRTADAGVLTLWKGQRTNTESAGEDITIWKVEFPLVLKVVAAKMIGYDMNSKLDASSETIGSYSTTYDFRTVGGYPEKILAKLNPYRRASFD